MRTFFLAFAGGFVGKLTATLLIAIALALSFGPDKWATAMLGLTGYGVWAARAVLFLFALLLVWGAFLKPPIERGAAIWTWRFRPEDRDRWPWRRLVPLDVAARRAYEKSRGRTPSARQITAQAADTMSKGQPLSWFGYALLGEGTIPVYGRHPPSTQLEIIPTQMIKGGAALSDDVKTSKRSGHTDLAIKRVDFKRRLREIESWHGQIN